MGAPAFVHLHVHTHYSLLDGATRIPELVAACKAMGMPAVAISDHGNMFGAIEFYRAAMAAGVKPILGMEAYIAPGDRRERTKPEGLDEYAYHLLLLATDLTGYRNLMKLASIAYLEGFYYKPRIDKAVLREYSAGLIGTSTCLGGEVPQTFLRRDAAAAKRAAEEYLSIFGPERFFIELQNHGIDDQRVLNPELDDLARRLGVGTIATNDVHYLRHEHKPAHDILCCINTRARLSDPDRFRLPTDQFYLKSPDEMATALPDYPDALAATLRVAEMCNVELDFNRRYAPVFRPPAGKTADLYLRELVYAGANERYGGGGAALPADLRERIDYELEVIAGKGFSSYFLIVWDFVTYARRHDIPCQARGSGCSTVVGYCLRISNVDPLRYGLYFERFMDPERDEMPDIDIDMCQDRRQEVIDYVRGKYGHVAQIITFGTLKARAAIRDICRVLDIPLGEADRVAKLVPEELHMTLDKALEQEAELRALYRADEKFRQVLDVGRQLEGLARHASVHAAGLVIADQPLDTLVPLYKAADGDDVITQFEGTTVEKVGLLKMDFLGLRTLSQVHRTLKLVREHHAVEVDLEALDLTDARVYALLARGETKGIFQFESGGMRDVLMKMKPNRIEDLIAANALFRPGPMQYINEYCARKHGKPWSTPHPTMTEVLRETYGIMVYQEQVSRLVNRLGDVPLRRAFRLAKAISKKKSDMIHAEREPFIDGCLRNGLKRETAEQIFGDILQFGGYAFNKAHSAGYALLAFQTAFLKTYYPVEFMAALLTFESGNTDKIAEYLHECRRVTQRDGSTGIPVHAPDVNASDLAFTVVYEAGRDGAAAQRGRILFGLAAISGLGEKACNSVIAARRAGGRFRDIYDLCERVDLQIVNKSALESLIKCGALDSTGAMRKALIDILPQAMEYGAAVQRDRRAGQSSLFGDLGPPTPPKPRITSAQWTEAELLRHEKDVLGFYITNHPLTHHLDALHAFSTCSTARLKELGDGTRVVLGGLISQVREIPIRSGRSAGRKMAAVTLEDLSGSVEAVVFPDGLERFRALLVPDRVVFVSGAVDRRREEAGLRVEQVTPIERATKELSRAVLLRLGSVVTEPPAGGESETGEPGAMRDPAAGAAVDRSGAARRAPLLAVRDVCASHRGRVPLYLEVQTSAGWTTTIQAGGALSVEPSDEFLAALRDVLGEDNVVCVGAGAGGPA